MHPSLGGSSLSSGWPGPKRRMGRNSKFRFPDACSPDHIRAKFCWRQPSGLGGTHEQTDGRTLTSLGGYLSRDDYNNKAWFLFVHFVTNENVACTTLIVTKLSNWNLVIDIVVLQLIGRFKKGRGGGRPLSLTIATCNESLYPTWPSCCRCSPLRALTTATAKRSFLMLNRLKTYLRSSIRMIAWRHSLSFMYMPKQSLLMLQKLSTKLYALTGLHKLNFLHWC